MEEFERDDGITEENGKKEKKNLRKAVRIVGRILAIVITVALVVGAVYLVANRDNISIDSIRRHLSYRLGKASVAETIDYTGNANGNFAAFDGGLLICSEHQIQFYDRAGTLIIDEKVDLERPVIDVQGGYAIVYDAGGNHLYLLHNEQIKRTYIPDKNQIILSARVNDSGWLTIVEEANGYKAAATVYNADFSPVVTERISSSFITDAILSPDRKILALVSIGEADSGFESVLLFYNLSDGELRGKCVLGSDVVLDMDWEKSGLWVMGEYGAYCVVDEAVALSAAGNFSRYLRGFSLQGDNFAAMFFSKYQGGSTGYLVVLNKDGNASQETISEEVLSVSAKGEYLAVLTGSELSIYLDDMTLYARVENTWNARRVLIREDGSALLVSNECASLYVPD